MVSIGYAPCSLGKKRDHIAAQCHSSIRCFTWYSVSSGFRNTELEVAGNDSPTTGRKGLQMGEGLNTEFEDVKDFKRLDVVIRLMHRSLIGHN